MIESPPYPAVRVLYASSSVEADEGLSSLLSMLAGIDASEVSPLVVYPGGAALAERLDEMDIPFETLKLDRISGAGPHCFTAGVWHLAWLIRSRGIHIVHACSTDIAEHCFVAARMAGSKIICHLPEPAGAPPRGKLFRQAVARCDHVITNSQSVKHDLLGLLDIGESHIAVIEDGHAAGAASVRDLYRRISPQPETR